MSGKLLRLCWISVFFSVPLSNPVNATLLDNYLPSAGAVINFASENVYPAILPTLFASGLPHNSRLPELPAGIITDPSDIPEFLENILPRNGLPSLYIEEPPGHPLAIAVSKQSGNKIHISSERQGEMSLDTNDRIFLLPGPGQPVRILEVTSDDLQVYGLPEDHDHLLNDMMPKPSGLVMVYLNWEGEWIITASGPEGVWEMSLEEYHQGISLLFESLLSLEFSELPVFTLGLETAGVKLATPRKPKKEPKIHLPSGRKAELPPESAASPGSARAIPDTADITNKERQINPIQVCGNFRILDQLHRFISPDELDKLTCVANDNSRRAKLEQLKKEGLTSGLYLTADTCNTLYWGLMNGELTEWQFLENYHYLTLKLMLVPEGQPVPASAALQGFSQRVGTFTVISPDPDTELTWENLSGARYLITITQEQGDYLLQFDQNPGPENLPVVAPEVRTQHFWHWMSIFPGGKGHLRRQYRIGSVFAIKRHFEDKSSPEDRVAMKPGFGAGDWDALKALRMLDQHPVALWHPDLHSLEQPDGLWIGAMPHLHDFIHLNLISGLSRHIRDEALTLDTLAIVPAIAFLQRFIQEQLTDLDRHFMSLCREQDDYLAIRSNQPGRKTKLDKETAKKMLKKLSERYLVDQPFFSLEEYRRKVEGDFYSCIYLQSPDAIDQLLLNLFIFTLVSGNHQNFTRQFLKVELKEHSNARRQVECCQYRSNKLSGFWSMHYEVIQKWFVDWWVRKLPPPGEGS